MCRPTDAPPYEEEDEPQPDLHDEWTFILTRSEHQLLVDLVDGEVARLRALGWDPIRNVYHRELENVALHLKDGE
jgi:hypothetical protein